MKKIHIILAFFLAFAGLFSSCNFLNVDEYFEDTFQMDSVFANKRNIERYFNGAVDMLPDEADIWAKSHIPGTTASDEVITCNDVPTGYGPTQIPGTWFTMDKITSTEMSGWGGWDFNVWKPMYKIIRKANMILANIDKPYDLSGRDKERMIAETRFLRAYAYSQMMDAYGPVILVGDQVYDTNEMPEYYATERATYDDCINYICNELEAAAPNLELKQPLDRFGRPTKGAALALVARWRLQQASPLFNGGELCRRYYGDWIRESDGRPYISQTYDERKWAVAAHAAKRVIGLGYQLYTVKKVTTEDAEGKTEMITPDLPKNVSSLSFPDGAGDIDPYRSYSEIFNGEAIDYNNPELIFALPNANRVNDGTWHSFPSTFGGVSDFGVQQKIVDAFYMADGRSIDNSSADYPYEARPTDESCVSDKEKQFSGYTLPKSTYGAYLNREMRFYANIGFSNCFWTMSSTSDNASKDKIITYYNGGNAGKDNYSIAGHYPLTGFVSKKFIHPRDARAGSGSKLTAKTFPIIRYAEILLIYAEALNNLTTSHTVTSSDGSTGIYSRDPNEIKKYFNQVRFRAGLPGASDTELETAQSFNKVIQRERMIELFQENRRFYDVRRWGIVEETEGQSIMGCNPDLGQWEGYYQPIIVNHQTVRERVFKPRLIFVPLPHDELRKVKGLVQNPGYDD